MIRLSRAHHPVRALGFGTRAGIWVQGCTLECSGCVSKDTWNSEDTKPIEVTEVTDWLRTIPEGDLDGVTISGGEPFEQPEALHELVASIRVLELSRTRPLDILCFSGLSISRLRADFAPILEDLDAVIPGPYIDSLPTDQIWRGSANQTLIPLSTLGHERYDFYVDHIPERRPMQVEVDTSGIWWIGIPGRGDMEQLRTAMRRKGLLTDHVSWEKE